MLKSQQYTTLLEKLFNPADSTALIDLVIFRKLCRSEDYHVLVDIVGILSRLFTVSRQKLSMRDLIGDSFFNKKQEANSKKIDIYADGLSIDQLKTIITELNLMRNTLKYTVYSLKISSIVTFLQGSLRQLGQNQQVKINEKHSGLTNDFDIIQDQCQKVQSQLISEQNFNRNNEFFKTPPHFLDGKFSNFMTAQKFLVSSVLPCCQKTILSIPLSHHQQRQIQLEKILSFISDYVVPQYQLQVEISKNTLVQTRIYINKLLRQHLIKNSSIIVKNISNIINEAILCPSMIKIQKKVLRVLRRLYLLNYSSTSSSENMDEGRNSSDLTFNIVNVIKNPLFLILRNIALFSQDTDDEIKQAAMLLYKLVHDKNDIEFSSLLQSHEQLRFLKNSKYYSSKAYIYSDEIQKVFDPQQIAGSFIKNHKFLAARQTWGFTVMVERPSSLLCWQFHVSNYDICFGVYKLQSLKELTHEQYEKNINCREIIKLERVQNTYSSPNRGHVYLKNGIYRVVFDNNFSMIRGKELFYSIQQLQSQF